jgi:SAM-dependent methyltransferase
MGVKRTSRVIRSGPPPQEPWVESLIQQYCHGNGIDIGCGWRKIREPVVGIDHISWGNLTNENPLEPHASQANWCFDAYDLPIKDDTMDFVFSCHSLEHMIDREAALREWLRVLKPNGFLVAIVPDINHCLSPMARKRGRIRCHGIEPDEIKDILKRLPIIVVRFNRYPGLEQFEIVAVKD